ncbi:MAG: hydroxyacid dehydrogenase [Frankiaceae bacterium]|nr:hydroxyacid dehydrogenase [Frankiaceae bacterium]MBV9871763.1 hydroxyacid dehydrogenase [Frankiaceae bacterium]
MTDRPRAFVIAPMRGEGLELLESICDITYEPWIDQQPVKMYGAEELAARIADLGATVLVCESDEVKGPVMDQPLKVIGCTRGDPVNVDLAAATEKGIPVLKAPGRNADAVAEITVGLLFAVTRWIAFADREVRAGQMYRDGMLPYLRFRAWELKGQTIGLVGYGAIGRAVAWRCEGLGMRVISFDPYAADATHSLEDLLAEADVVSMHAPVTDETRGMIGAEQFAAMKPGVVYLNAARAALHDTDALVAALQSGHVGAAGLDHFDHEWLDATHPLASMDNVVLTPHIGGATYNTESNHASLIAHDIAKVLAGERPERCANPEVFGS